MTISSPQVRLKGDQTTRRLALPALLMHAKKDGSKGTEHQSVDAESPLRHKGNALRIWFGTLA
tara:strand:+ start:187 stop:375 length:189 start_codon:yes stop_codon:yes gene_type:complete